MKTLAAAVALLAVSVSALADEVVTDAAREAACRPAVVLSDEQMDGVVAGGVLSYWVAGLVTLDVHDSVITSDPGFGIVKSG